MICAMPAVKTLLDWYRDGGDVEARLPLLYVPRSCQSQLNLLVPLRNPRTLALAAERLERALGTLP